MGVKKKNKHKKKPVDLNYEINNNIEEIEDNDNHLLNEKFEKKENPFNFNIKYEEEDEKDIKEEIIKEEEKEEEEVDEKEINNKKCSLDEHKEIDAIYYCQECKINMCNKCEKVHSGLLKNHHIYQLNKDINEIFTGLCTKRKHSMILEYYCKTHNKLCCAACISKIRNKGNGEHKDCEIYLLTKIKNNKKENLEKNMKNLQELSNELEPSIKELKNIYEKINESKDKLKMEIQNIFTKIRTELNNREDKLYEEIDKKFNELYFKVELIKESEKLPNLVKTSLEKGKIKENDWNDENNLSKLINDCISVENTIKNINIICDKIKNFNSNKDLKFEFLPKNDDIEKGLLNKIQNFGSLKVLENQIKLKKEKKFFLDDDDEENNNDLFYIRNNNIPNENNNMNLNMLNTE